MRKILQIEKSTSQFYTKDLELVEYLLSTSAWTEEDSQRIAEQERVYINWRRFWLRRQLHEANSNAEERTQCLCSFQYKIQGEMLYKVFTDLSARIPLTEITKPLNKAVGAVVLQLQDHKWPKIMECAKCRYSPLVALFFVHVPFLRPIIQQNNEFYDITALPKLQFVSYSYDIGNRWARKILGASPGCLTVLFKQKKLFTFKIFELCCKIEKHLSTLFDLFNQQSESQFINVSGSQQNFLFMIMSQIGYQTIIVSHITVLLSKLSLHQNQTSIYITQTNEHSVNISEIGAILKQKPFQVLIVIFSPQPLQLLQNYNRLEFIYYNPPSLDDIFTKYDYEFLTGYLNVIYSKSKETIKLSKKMLRILLGYYAASTKKMIPLITEWKQEVSLQKMEIKHEIKHEIIQI